MKLNNRVDMAVFNSFGRVLTRLELIGYVRATIKVVYSSFPSEDYDGFSESHQELIVVQVSDKDIGYTEYEI